MGGPIRAVPMRRCGCAEKVEAYMSVGQRVCQYAAQAASRVWRQDRGAEVVRLAHESSAPGLTIVRVVKGPGA